MPPAHRAAALLLLLLLPACTGGPGSGGSGGPGSDDPGAGDPGGRLEVAAGFYPYEFVASRVGGPDARVVNLTEAGGEPHDLELSPQQVASLATTDLVVYAAGFQPAVDQAVEQQAGDRALDVLGTVELRPGPGGQGDPHVWLDPVRLAGVAAAVAERLGQRSPGQAEAFRQRARELDGELRTLDAELRQGLARCERREVVTSHDAFGYLTAAYGLEQVPIAGLSPDDEASPQRLVEVATLARQRGVTTVFFEQLVSPKVAESLAREVGAQAAVLDPLEGPPRTGDYLSAMRTTLTTLRAALGCT